MGRTAVTIFKKIGKSINMALFCVQGIRPHGTHWIKWKKMQIITKTGVHKGKKKNLECTCFMYEDRGNKVIFL